METRKLFESVQLGEMHLVNCMVMAPMTRSRSSQPGDIPNELMALYYAQRASAGLQVTEAIQISRLRQGWPLAEADIASLFGGNDHGYTDYPTFLQATGMVIADDLDA